MACIPPLPPRPIDRIDGTVGWGNGSDDCMAFVGFCRVEKELGLGVIIIDIHCTLESRKELGGAPVCFRVPLASFSILIGAFCSLVFATLIVRGSSLACFDIVGVWERQARIG
jgi:hypothetical protein